MREPKAKNHIKPVICAVASALFLSACASGGVTADELREEYLNEQAIKEMAGSYAEQVKEDAKESIKEGAKEAADSVKDAAYDKAIDIKDEAQDAAANKASELHDIAEEKAPEIEDKARDVADKAAEQARQAYNIGKEQAKEGADSYLQSIKNDWQDILDALNGNTNGGSGSIKIPVHTYTQTPEIDTDAILNGTDTTHNTSTRELTKPPVTADMIPPYDGHTILDINDSTPFFTDSELTTDSFELYSSLDSRGRCGTAYANICTEMMPDGPRGDIGMIKPTGWRQNKYEGIIDEHPPYLYNRCHLIAFSLGGNDQPNNLITGTRYFNIETGMEQYELAVLSYVRRTNNHVLYRVTPLFDGDNLLAKGVLMEARSVEDNGLIFCKFIYNVQPGIKIDYSTGDNWAA